MKYYKYGWFSQKMADCCGFVVYATPNGEVQVTTVSNSKDAPGSVWGDEKLVYEQENPDDPFIYLKGELKSWRGDGFSDRRLKPKHNDA